MVYNAVVTICSLLIHALGAYTQSTTSDSPSSTCTSPSGFANTVVFAPNALATINHQIDDSFVNTHAVDFTEVLNIAISQAAVASFCLDTCIAYTGNATSNLPCLSFSVDMGKPYPPNASDTAVRWFCTIFDAALSPGLYEAIDAESYMHAVGVNRVCEGTFRAY